MKAKLLPIIFLSILFPVFAQEDFTAIVDFDTTLKDASLAVSKGEARSLTDKYIVLYGTVQSRTVVVSDPETFVGEVHLVSGEWIGYEDVRMYRCVVRFKGEEYVERIPARPSRRPSDMEIPIDANVIVIGKIAGTRVDTDGTGIPVLEGIKIRVVHSD